MTSYTLPSTSASRLAHAAAWADYANDHKRYPATPAPLADPDFASLCATWAAHLVRDAGAQPTKHYADETGRVLLGQRDLADAQRDADGDLVALVCGRRV
jgi:hypothetical protein